LKETVHACLSLCVSAVEILCVRECIRDPSMYRTIFDQFKNIRGDITLGVYYIPGATGTTIKHLPI